jgi:hypothetical protein
MVLKVGIIIGGGEPNYVKGAAPTEVGGQFWDKNLPALAKAKRKNPAICGVFTKRMMGLEPTTFCMASRRSSQLSYIRVGRSF